MEENKRYHLSIYEYERIGEISLLYVFHIRVYSRIGNVKWLLGYVWGNK